MSDQHTKIVRADTFEALFLHADTTRSFTQKIKVTDHPIDGKANVADHAQSELTRFNIVGVMSELGILNAGGPEVGGIGSPLDRSRDYLRRAEGKELTVYVPRRGEYSPCLLTSWDNTDRQSEAIEFDLSFKVVRFAQSQTVEIPPERTPEPDLASEAAQGSQASVDYFKPEVPKRFTNKAQFDDQANQAKGRKSDKEVADKSLAVQGSEAFAGGST